MLIIWVSNNSVQDGVYIAAAMEKEMTTSKTCKNKCSVVACHADKGGILNCWYKPFNCRARKPPYYQFKPFKLDNMEISLSKVLSYRTICF